MPKYDVFFDLETGGLELRHPIIQIAAIVVGRTTGRAVTEFECKLLVDETQCEAEALRINHYDRDVWADVGKTPRQAAMAFADLLKAFACDRLISKRTRNPYYVARLVGHNAVAFDGPRIKKLFDELKLFMPADLRIRDTLQLALWHFDKQGVQLDGYTISDLCKYLGIGVEGAHDALMDVRLNIEIARRLGVYGKQTEWL